MQTYSWQEPLTVRQVTAEEAEACADVIRRSFRTVAEDLGFTPENAPGFTAFSTTPDKLRRQMESGETQFFLCRDRAGNPAGCYGLTLLSKGACELRNLCVLPEYRHRKVGRTLLTDAFRRAAAMGCNRMNIGIVEENRALKRWYESFGFTSTGTEKLNFFPFTCGYMEKPLR